MVVIWGSREPEQMSLSKSGLCSVSVFFHEAFNESSKKAKDKEIVLNNVHSEVMKSFLAWIDSNTITNVYEGYEGYDPYDSKYKHLVDVYLFGYRIKSRQLMNFTMDQLQNTM